MRTTDIILGLQILNRYCSDEFAISAVHDVIAVYTDEEKPIPQIELEFLWELGWFQENINPGEYSPKEYWICYV
jgi:hypothetical protein